MSSTASRFPGIKFCPECNNMLYPKEDKQRRVLMNVCRNCDYKIEATNPCVFYQSYENDRRVLELKNINPAVIVDPTLPMTKDHLCPSCGHNESVFFEAQTKQADHDLRLYYVCKACQRRWTDDE